MIMKMSYTSIMNAVKEHRHFTYAEEGAGYRGRGEGYMSTSPSLRAIPQYHDAHYIQSATASVGNTFAPTAYRSPILGNHSILVLCTFVYWLHFGLQTIRNVTEAKKRRVSF